MNKTKPCYLFFDLDGTVLLKGKLPPQTLQAMKAVQRMGHKLILNTGRSRGNTLPSVAAFDVPWDGMIFGGGSEIHWNNELLYRQTVSAENCREWLAYCLQNSRTIIFGGSEKVLVLDKNDHPMPVSDKKREDCFSRLDEALAKDWITNLTIREILTPDYPKNEMTVIQLPTYADIFPPNCNKGNAVLRFCEITGASLEQCVCLGDSQNDLDMFRVCPTGICMAHAPKELIELSTYHAQTELGVAEGLHYLFDDIF